MKYDDGFIISGSFAVFSIGHISADWRRWGDMAIVGVAGLTAILLYCMATYGNIWLAYVGYCLVRVSYQVLMTVASFEIVKYLPEDAFALIFGINTFAAVGVQSLLSLIVNTILGKKISELKVKSLELRS